MSEKLSLKKVKFKDIDGILIDGVETKCESCGFSPVYIPYTNIQNGDMSYLCPNCQVFHALGAELK